MGQQAHILRLALGRSADLPPDWDSLSDQWHQRGQDVNEECPLYVSTNSKDVSPVYDGKGRPVDPTSRSWEDNMCQVQNQVLKLALTELCDDGDNSDALAMQAHSRAIEQEAKRFLGRMKIVSTLFGQLDHFVRCWLDVVLRSLFLQPQIGVLSLTDIITMQMKRCNVWALFRLPYAYATARLMDIVESTESRIYSHVYDIKISRPQYSAMLDNVVPHLVSFGGRALVQSPTMVFSMMQYLRLQSMNESSGLVDTLIQDLQSSFWRYPAFNLQALIVEYIYEKGAREIWDMVFSLNAMMSKVKFWPGKPIVASSGQYTQDQPPLVANILLHAWGWSGTVPEHMKFVFIQCPHMLIYFMGGLNLIHLLGDVLVAPFEALMLRNISMEYFGGAPSRKLLLDFGTLFVYSRPSSTISLVRGFASKMVLGLALRAAVGLTMTSLYSAIYCDLEGRRLMQVRRLNDGRRVTRS